MDSRKVNISERIPKNVTARFSLGYECSSNPVLAGAFKAEGAPSWPGCASGSGPELSTVLMVCWGTLLEWSMLRAGVAGQSPS